MGHPFYLQEALGYLDEWFAIQKRLDPLTAGYSVSISYQGDVVYKKGLGFAHLGNEEAMSADHFFRVASHSKTFTAVAVMQLMDQGKLDIHDAASKYLPFLLENPDARVGRVSIAQMLSHHSGMGRDGGDPSFWRLARPFPNVEEVLDFFKTQPLVLDGDVRFKYSNFAYALLGMLIEAVSGLSYTAYMQENILKPLGLSHVMGEYEGQDIDLVTGYSPPSQDGLQMPISSAVHTDGIVGATGFCARAEDLCRFYSAVIEDSDVLMNRKLKKMMLEQQAQIPDQTAKGGYAYGFACEVICEQTLRGHSGGMPGNISQTRFDPESGIVVSILTNSHMGKPDMLQKGVWHILDFFKKHSCETSPYKDYKGWFYDIWGASCFVPAKDKIYVSSPFMNEPFTDCSELEHLEGHTFQITKENGYGCFGEKVEFAMDGTSVTSVSYAGYPKQSAEAFADFVRKGM